MSGNGPSVTNGGCVYVPGAGSVSYLFERKYVVTLDADDMAGVDDPEEVSLNFLVAGLRNGSNRK